MSTDWTNFDPDRLATVRINPEIRRQAREIPLEVIQDSIDQHLEPLFMTAGSLLSNLSEVGDLSVLDGNEELLPDEDPRSVRIRKTLDELEVAYRGLFPAIMNRLERQDVLIEWRSVDPK